MDSELARLGLLMALGQALSQAQKNDYERMVGNVGYTVSEAQGLVELRVDKIEHNATTTGTMRISLWACTSCAQDNSSWTGKRIASANLDSIGKGYCYTNIKRTVALDRPAPGQYIAVMTLESKQNGGFVIEDKRRFEKRLVIGNSQPQIMFILA